jgi:archaellum component FlaC
MGVIEDVRSALQDFVAPELHELQARIDALAEQQKQFRADVDKRFDAVDKRFDTVDKRFDGVEKRFDGVDKRFDSVDKRFEKLEDKLSNMRDEILTEIRRTANIYDLSVRVAKLEAERHSAQ